MKNDTPAPIALFVYNRLGHTKKTVEALQKNALAKESALFIFSDGPKNEEAREGIQELRTYLKSVTGFAHITITERNENLGLARSIIIGVTEIVNRYGKVIVLEDDLVTSPFFLEYMNAALTVYENEEKVISIHGYVYPVKKPLPETFFLRGADCWGWATWKRGWNLFETDGKKLLSEIERKGLTRLFDFNGSYGFSSLLKRQIAGKSDSWAIRWYASAFVQDKLTLYPGTSLVENIGQDKTGTHGSQGKFYATKIAQRKIAVTALPSEENKEARRIIQEFFTSLKTPAWKRIIKEIVPRSIIDILKRPAKYGFFGNYPTWQKALQASKGYDSALIFEKLKKAALKVKNGEAAYERDTVTFPASEYNQELLSPLLSRAQKDGKLRIIDIGGSFGNTYLRHKEALKNVKDLAWSVVEQKHIVDFGRKEFANDALSFFEDSELDKALSTTDPTVCLFGSSIQYMEKPYDILKKIADSGVRTIIIERTPFILTGNERITVQKVNPAIYDASYPAWILDDKKITDFLALNSFILVSKTENGLMSLNGKDKVALKTLIYES